MIPSSILGIVFALASAVSWGTGDFGGGVATRTKNQFQVLFLASLPGIVILGLMALVTGEPLPSWRDILWAFSGGLSGALGIAYFYQGLSRETPPPLPLPLQRSGHACPWSSAFSR